MATPVARFVTANAGVKEFVWRTRGGSDEDNGALHDESLAFPPASQSFLTVF